jgi:hypothetical protein
MAKCGCVPEAVTYQDTCTECLGNNLDPKPDNWDSEMDDAYKGISSILIYTNSTYSTFE